MKLLVERIGKQYNHRWIFRNISFSVDHGAVAGITGQNGSGKSTVLQILADHISPDKGQVSRFTQGTEKVDFHPNQISIASPYLELFEEFTVEESIELQARFKPWRKGLSTKSILEQTLLEMHADKEVMNLSSGMKQRLKLALAIFAESPLLLLDEPCSNLDEKFSAWYNDILASHKSNRTVIICSNHDAREINQCEVVFDLNLKAWQSR